MVGRSGILLLLLFSITSFTSFPVFGEETADHERSTGPGPGPLRRVDDGTGKSEGVDALKTNVKEKINAGTEAWWQSVHDLLGKLSKEQAKEFLKEIPEGRRRDLFQHATAAREADAKQLREMAKNNSVSDRREAAAQEVRRRINDPNTRLIAENFAMRPERAMQFADELLKAKDDPQKAAQLIARLMGTLNRSQRQALFDATKKALDENTPGLDRALLERLNQAAAVSLGAQADNAFKQSFQTAYNGVLERNRQFQQRLANALGGDAKAVQDLVSRYGKDGLMDFIAGQLKSGNDGLAVDLAKAVARKDAQGNLFLDLAPDNAAFPADAKGQSLFLGNEKANNQIRAALSAFDLANAKDHDGATSFDPGTRGRFQNFSLGSGPAEGARRVFASPGKDGPTLTAMQGNELPTNLATQDIREPSRLPPPRVAAEERPQPKQEEKGKQASPQQPAGGDRAAQFVSFIQAKCIRCHNGDIATPLTANRNFTINKGGRTLNISQMLTAIDRVPAMRNAVTPADKEALRSFSQ